MKVKHQAPAMNTEQLSYLIEFLFTDECYEERALFVLDYHAAGRICENFTIQCCDLDIVIIDEAKVRCMRIDWTRHKTGVGHLIHFFAHRSNWLLCPMHALASFLVTDASNSPGGNIFPDRGKGFLKRINLKFRECAKHWEKDTRHSRPVAFPLDGSSHTLRRTVFTNSAADAQVTCQMLDRRGGIASRAGTRDYDLHLQQQKREDV